MFYVSKIELNLKGLFLLTNILNTKSATDRSWKHPDVMWSLRPRGPLAVWSTPRRAPRTLRVHTAPCTMHQPCTYK